MTKFDVLGFGALNVDMLFKVEKFATAEKESFIKITRKPAAAQQQTRL